MGSDEFRSVIGKISKAVSRCDRQAWVGAALLSKDLDLQAAYTDFLTLWREADADIPILKQAKEEYTNLRD